MFVSKKKYEFLLTRYEEAASRADQMEMTFRAGAGRLYKCILECREVAQAITQPGTEDPGLTTKRLAFIDHFLSTLIPVVTRRMSDAERLMWEDALKDRTADIYRPLYCGCLPEEKA